MKASAILQRAHDAARRHALAQVALFALPWITFAFALAWRWNTGAWPWLLALVPAAVAAWFASRAWRRTDRSWLARSLDARRTDMEDSADLLVGIATPRTTLQALQRERLQARIEAGAVPDLRAAWFRRRLVGNAMAAALGIAALLLWPATPAMDSSGRASTASDPVTASPPRLAGRQLEIHPPGYTGLPVQRGERLSAKVAIGSELRWRLRFAPQAREAALVFHDGSRLALDRADDGSWNGRRRIDRATFYRIEPAQPAVDGQPPLHRIDTIADRAPQVKVLQPARTLSVLTPGQRRWTVAFEASDDYGLATSARLRVTRTEGSGENITAKEQNIALRGSGGATRRRYAHTFDLAALGLVAGDDLIAQLIVSDRAPRPHVVASPSLILRWPPEQLAQASGLDGMMKKVMPAYFRSQRQIIIDAEALLKEKPRLAADKYLERSDVIGVDQRLLRLRYGQFLGEESEGGPQPALPTNDAPAQESPPPLPTNDAPAQPAVAADNEHAPGDGHDHDDDDDAPQRAAVFGEEQQVLERYGHTHDIPEAATLLDPKTRELLRSALDEMWQSEVNLRTGHPEAALPYAYRALDLIKRVQQSERIYLSKVGPELPPIDPARRLKGERAGLGDRGDPMRAASTPDPTLANAWQALAPVASAQRRDPDIDALGRWLATHDTRAGDPLAIAAAIEALRRDPRCQACRQRLRDQLWPLLARPPAAPAPRQPSSRIGDAYLDALGKEAAP